MGDFSLFSTFYQIEYGDRKDSKRSSRGVKEVHIHLIKKFFGRGLRGQAAVAQVSKVLVLFSRVPQLTCFWMSLPSALGKQANTLLHVTLLIECCDR